MSRIPANRAVFVDENNRITPVWERYLRDLGMSSTDIDIMAANAATIAQAALAKSAENTKQLTNALTVAMQTRMNAELGELRKRLANAEALAARRFAAFADVQRLDGRLANVEAVAYLPAPRISGGGIDEAEVIALIEDTVDAPYIESKGYWSPLTNGDPVLPELIFDSFGDVIMTWQPTP